MKPRKPRGCHWSGESKCSYPKLTWPEPPRGFGIYGGRSTARRGRAHHGHTAAVPIVIQLPQTAKAQRPRHMEDLHAVERSEDAARADAKRVFRRMSGRMRSLERKEVKVCLSITACATC